MGDILRFKKKTPWQKHKGKSLCRKNFHKWKLATDNQFDSKQGKLTCIYSCQRCGVKKKKQCLNKLKIPNPS